MKLMIWLLAPAVALTSGCIKNDTRGECGGESVCPITIVGTASGGFTVQPDTIKVHRNGTTALLWTFADPSKYEFQADPGGPKGDGVVFSAGTTAQLRIGPCMITNDSKKVVAYAKTGAYYRCEVQSFATTVSGLKYTIRFHGKDGTLHTVDPTVDITGTPDEGVKSDLDPVKVNAGDPVVLGTLPPNEPGIRVVWYAGGNNNFVGKDGDAVTFTSGGTPYDNPSCYVADNANGDNLSDKSAYYACIFSNSGPYDLKYKATYHDSANTPAFKESTLKR